MKIRDDGQLQMDYNDKVVIQLLMTDASISPESIAKYIQGYGALKIRNVKSRLKKLKNFGVVKQTIELNEDLFGVNYRCMIFVKLHDTKNIQVFTETMEVLWQVRMCQLVSGEYDYILHTKVRNKEEQESLLEYLYNTDLIAKMQNNEIKEVIFQKQQVPLL